MEKNYSTEDCQKYASLFVPIIQIVDTVIDEFDVKLADEIVEGLFDNASTAMSGSILMGADGHLKADAMKKTAETTKAIVDIFKARIAQRDQAREMNEQISGREAVEKMFGL